MLFFKIYIFNVILRSFSMNRLGYCIYMRDWVVKEINAEFSTTKDYLGQIKKNGLSAKLFCESLQLFCESLQLFCESLQLYCESLQLREVRSFSVNHCSCGRCTLVCRYGLSGDSSLFRTRAKHNLIE